MNVTQMLMYGPKLQASAPYVPKKDRKQNRKSITFRGVQKYKNHSDGDIVYSTMVAARMGISITTATKQLKVYFDAGLLEAIGKAPSRSQNKPILYRWK